LLSGRDDYTELFSSPERSAASRTKSSRERRADASSVSVCGEQPVHGVHGELMLKLLWKASIALGSESASGWSSMWFSVWDYLQLQQPSYHRQVRKGCDVGCNWLAIKK
jgi:hypothetical protein